MTVNFAKDESYTPAIVVLQAGDSTSTLLDIAKFEINEENGKDLGNSATLYEFDLVEHNDNDSIDALCLRLLIMNNHSQGKDSRIRNIAIFAKSNLIDNDTFEFPR